VYPYNSEIAAELGVPITSPLLTGPVFFLGMNTTKLNTTQPVFSHALEEAIGNVLALTLGFLESSFGN